MDFTHRRDSEAVEHVQAGNRAWWTRNTMSYDWKDAVGSERLSPGWFDEIDRRFIHASRLFATRSTPFDRVIPFADLRGRRVLEIGCGMGLHTELLARAGAQVTAVDLSPVSVDVTRRRLALKGLTGDVQEGDAESLPFADRHFDFVWSWGVIHHSSRTGRIVREIARLLSPEGETRVMVYNRSSTTTLLAVLRDQLLRGGLFRRSLEESLYMSTDGYSARFYPREQFEDLFRTFFRDVSSEICGQDTDAVPLPRLPRRVLMPLLPEDFLQSAQAKRGSFILLRGAKPE